MVLGLSINHITKIAKNRTIYKLGLPTKMEVSAATSTFFRLKAFIYQKESLYLHINTTIHEVNRTQSASNHFTLSKAQGQIFGSLWIYPYRQIQ